jgi:cytidyltransferase-like protein
MVIGYLPMTADLFHVGHINAILKANKLCDKLYIGLLTDKAIKKYKGQLPVIPESQRQCMLITMLNTFGYSIIMQGSINPFKNLKKWKADILFSGDGFTEEEQKAAEKLGIALCEFPYHEGQSTTKIKQRVIKQNYGRK